MNILSITLVASPYLNLPLRDNNVPAVRKLLIRNEGEQPIGEFSVRLSATPEVIKTVTWPVHSLAPGAEYLVSLERLELDYPYLRNLVEAERGVLVASCLDNIGKGLARATSEVRLLPPQHWGGSAAVPEMLAAHVMPNDAGITNILRRAAELLDTQQLAFNAYQSEEPRKAGTQAIAIVQAISELGLLYAQPPASFERYGQKVRTPADIIEDKLGTCLDLACLVAACFEQAGLHAVIIIEEEHAYTTVWLQPSPISTGVIHDVQALRKALDNGLLLAFETTALTGRQANVNSSITQGNTHLVTAKKFQVAIDLHAARRGEHIRPLNLSASPTEVSPSSSATSGNPNSPESNDKFSIAGQGSPLGELVGRPAIENSSPSQTRDESPSSSSVGRPAIENSPISQTESGAPSSSSVGRPAIENSSPSQTGSGAPSSSSVGRPAIENSSPSQTRDESPSSSSVGRPAIENSSPSQTGSGAPSSSSVGRPAIENSSPSQTEDGSPSSSSVGRPAIENSSPSQTGDRTPSSSSVGRPAIENFSLDLSALDGIREGQASPNTSPSSTEEPPVTGSARVQRWKSQLLNLTRRNRLLNWRPTGGAMHLRFVDGALLEDRLASGSKYNFEAVDTLRATKGELGRELADNHYARAISEALTKDKLLVVGEQTTLQANLLKLERAARQSLEEGGANTLFLAIGFAVRPKPGMPASFDPKARAADKPEYTAPLILLPVELKRRRAGATFTLVTRDEDAVLNPTLQELLKQETGVDFGNLSRELPIDESGVDVAGILQLVKDKLLNVPGWEVVNEVALGEFSFAKYLMWRDLDAFEDELKANAVVKHLIDTPREPFYDPTDATAREFPEPAQLDESFPVAEMLTPLSADASQLAAIRAAAQGINFVLEGPPGTGKSQTITNLIAQCLGEGKTVLFVSEKTAALEVVERRLRQVGLGEFCLELHSNRATKTAVYDQLREAMKHTKASTTQYITKAAALAEVRSNLNSQVDALHTMGKAGLTVYQLVSYAATRPETNAPEPHSDVARSLSVQSLQSWRELVRTLALRINEVSPAARLALRPIGALRDMSAFAKTCHEVVDTVTELNIASAKLATLLEGNDLQNDLAAQQTLGKLAELLVQAKGQDYSGAAAIIESGIARRDFALTTEATLGLVAAYGALSAQYRSEVSSLDAVTLSAKWQQNETSFALWRWIQHWLIARKLKPYATGEINDIGADLRLLAEVNDLQRKVNISSGKTIALTPEAVGQAQQRAQWIDRLSNWAANDSSVLIGVTAETLRKVLTDIAEERLVAREILDAAQGYPAVLAKAELALTALVQDYDLAERALTNNAAISLAQGFLAHERDWRTHGLYAEARMRANEAGLQYFTDADYELSGLGRAAHEVIERFELGVRRVLAKAELQENLLLRTFSGSAFEDLILRFKRLDAEFQRITQEELKARLHERQQGIYRQDLREAVGVLNNELQKKRRQLPVRQLVSRIGTLLPELTPCVLMSPLSIAQYLPAESADIKFDVVVFDEASQIPVWDAIGAIARGKQVLVVGDSKQLPPTNFFSRADADEVYDTDNADEMVVEDMESILDEMKAASLRTRRLRWHYRSRAESLIAFSNRTYYNGELHTFPAPVADDKAVRWHKVESRDYLSGRNRAEARALVDYLVERLRKTAPSEQTFGVVTFGMAQQTLIEDMLEDSRQDYPEIEAHFSPELDERLFVKNIENVQGDERAVILFSITYGPDAAGKVAMRFGPMNSSGGERRLNVAITRAREEMHLFSSMEPEQIDLKRLGANAQGARDLRYFMEFAKRGPRAFADKITSVGGANDFDSPFEQAVSEALRARGYETDPQVGVSGYRIDLGVRNAKREGHYMAGIECDGASYHSTATARERDLLRQQVLEGLGWNIIRIWSLDWWHDRERTLDKVVAELERLAIDSGSDRYERPHKQIEAPSIAVETDNKLTYKLEEPRELNIQEYYQYTEAAALQQFLPAHWQEGQFESKFYEGKLDGAIRKMVSLLLKSEAPIMREALVKRIAMDGLDFGRTGSKIRDRINGMVAEIGYEEVESAGDTVVWSSIAQRDELITFRPPVAGAQESRGISDIPERELIALAKALIPTGLDADALIREMGTSIGVASVRGSSRERVERAIEVAWGK